MKNERIAFLSVLFIFLFRIESSHAQSDNIDFQTWSDFTYTYTIKNRTNIGADFGIRGLVSKNEWNQVYFRPTYKYYFNIDVQVAGGVAVFATFSDVIENTTEFRIFQEMTAAWPIYDHIEFFHRLRFEERFFTYEGDSQFNMGLPNDFEVRSRYQLSVETVDFQVGNNENSSIYFLASWELFYPINKAAVERFVNNQRILGGFGHRFNHSFKYEIHYIFQKSRRFSEEGLRTSEHILRLRLFLLHKSESSVDNKFD